MGKKVFNSYWDNKLNNREKYSFEYDPNEDVYVAEENDYDTDYLDVEKFENLNIFGDFPQERLVNNPASDIRELLDLFVHMGSKIEHVISDEIYKIIYIGQGLHVAKTRSKFFIFDGRDAAIKNKKLVGTVYPLFVSVTGKK